MKNEIKSIIGWIAFLVLLFFSLFCAWDYVSTKFAGYEKRLVALEQEARPLFIVDKYSSVYLNGEEVYGRNNPGDK